MPHRYPFLLIDSVLECVPSKRAVCLKNVSVNEAYFAAGSVMPEPLIMEAMAQSSIVLLADEEHRREFDVYLGSVKIEFLDKVVPGDRLVITVDAVKILSGQGLVDVTAEVAGNTVARGQIGFAVKWK